MKKAIVILSAIFIPLVFFSQTKTWWTPQQIMKLKTVTAVRVSPDGKQVVYSIREAIITDDRSEYINQLYLTGANGKNTIQLTTGEVNNINPKWRPDGKAIAFISNRDGRNNLYILTINAPNTERLTDVQTGIVDFEWRPDGKAIAYIMNEAPTDAEEKKKKTKNDWYFMDDEPKSSGLYILWLSETDSAGKRKVMKFSHDKRNISSISWSPDGKRIAYQHGLSVRIAGNSQSDLAMVNVETGEVKSIAATKATEWQPLFSPDGKWIAYRSTDEESTRAGIFRIKIVAAGGGKPFSLATTPDENSTLMGWSADGQSVYVSEPYRTGLKVFQLSQDGKRISQWSKNGKDIISAIELNDKGTHFGVVMQSVTKPEDAYMSSAVQFSPAKISDINPWVANFPIPTTEVVKWKSFDGKEIEALLIYPLTYESGKKYPLLLHIHGGPAGAWVEGFPFDRFERHPLLSFAERGMFVLRPNPRGSVGYGLEFRLANQRDWGGGDYQDIMAGVDYTISKGWADSSKLGVIGWSYGGFMSSWIISHTHRFKAASIGAPWVDLTTSELTNNITTGTIASYNKKQPWEDWTVYDEHSPLRFVQNVKTPVLLQHGEVDANVPFSQSAIYYEALKRRGVPVRLLVLPRQAHGQSEPKMSLKLLETNLEWMEHYLLAAPLSF